MHSCCFDSKELKSKKSKHKEEEVSDAEDDSGNDMDGSTFKRFLRQFYYSLRVPCNGWYPIHLINNYPPALEGYICFRIISHPFASNSFGSIPVF